ncbi:nuclease-related domain-containing protein [Ureibacillus aquaedulcis]|uniref:Nuclease-related domain-containing protein n=1 Tax=Ureibacillus aquaedulcis TaxID=3058421 RepID=A0ABT8GSB9_9BACL|nr:nuclease-related domain-containing protein [Ureibacillus sp. BA0131]MDN4494303.1 nuclease-related domain-containing protein [Ureibacillus sp. BA0131]
MRNLFFKSRIEPTELVILRLLNRRMQLSKTDLQNYLNLKKGYEGELMFDSLTKNLTSDCLILNDLLLKANNQTFQIDSLIIMNNQIYVFEIKNYSGDYYYKSDRLFHNDRTEISNPLIQLSRTETLLRQMLRKLNIAIPIQASVIFINPEFTMYHAPTDKPFIFPGQVKRLMNRLNEDHTNLNDQHKELAETLRSLHIKENPYQQLPIFEFNEMKKGMTCALCDSFEIKIIGLKCTCPNCGYSELFDSAVERNVKEFKILFPNEKITTIKMVEWCKITSSKQRIQRSLKKHFNQLGEHKWSYYE